MTESVREQILQAIATRLETISIAGGYANNFPGGVQRFTQDPGKLDLLPTIGVIWQSETKVKQEPNYACTMFVDVSIYAFDPVNDSTLTDTQLDSLETDVATAVEVDPQFTGLAREMMILGSDPFPVADGMPFVGRTVRLQLDYQHRITDPTIKG